MRRTIAVVAASVLAACGGSSEPCDFDDAGKFTGSYLVSYDERSGDCGELPDAVVLITSGSTIEAGCVINSHAQDPEACTTDADLTCTDTGTNVKLRVVGHLDAEPDGTKLTGVVTLTANTLSTGAAVCTSTYGVTYRRQ